MQINFEPVQLKEANRKLDRYMRSARLHKKDNEVYKKEVFKESLWEKFVGVFKRRF
jgi:hypothetical protein